MAKTNKKVEKRSKQLIIVAVALIAIIGVSYAWLTQVLNGTKTNKIVAGNLSLDLGNESTGINIDPAIPQSDEDGVANTYTFKLTNNGTVPAVYKIYLDNDTISSGAEQISDNMIKYRLNKGETTGTIGFLTNRVIDSGTIYPANDSEHRPSEISYTLSLWITSTAVQSDLATYKCEINNEFNASYTTESACKAADGKWRPVPKEFAGKLRIEASQENVDIDSGYHLDYSNGQAVAD